MAPDTESAVGNTRAGIEALYVREWSPLLRLAYLLTDSRSTAEEIVQDAFVRLQATSTHVLNPEAFLRTIVANACKDIHRHKAVVARTPLPREDHVLANHDELFDALAELPWRQQAALVLRFHVDLPDSEIAAVLGCRPNTVRSIIHRALATLRKELGA